MTKKKNDLMVRIAVRVHPSHLEKIDRLAKANGMLRSEYIRHMIITLREPKA